MFQLFISIDHKEKKVYKQVFTLTIKYRSFKILSFLVKEYESILILEGQIGH